MFEVASYDNVNWTLQSGNNRSSTAMSATGLTSFGEFQIGQLNSVVTNLADSGPGSLRYAIAHAPNGSTITFTPAASGTLTLTSGEILINKDLNITKGSATVGGLWIVSNISSRLFTISPGAAVSIGYLMLSTGNPGPTANGGLILNEGDLTIHNCLLSNGNANYGGAIYNDTSATLNVSVSTFNSNNADYGAAIYSAGILDLRTSTINGNAALVSGGGIEVENGASITSSIIAGNTASTSGPDGYIVGGSITSGGYNLIGINQNFSFTQGTGDIIGTLALPRDPKVGGLANANGPNIGNTMVMTLQSTSPAIDAGDPVDMTPDQIGQNISIRRDIGAFESSFLPSSILVVEENGLNGAFTTITDAVNAATAGDTILIYPRAGGAAFWRTFRIRV